MSEEIEPGAWKIQRDDSDDGIQIVERGGSSFMFTPICTVQQDGDFGEQVALLILAAPKMLASLRAIRSNVSKTSAIAKICDAAISEAEGRA